MAQPPQPSQPPFGSWIIQTLTPSWVSDITLFRQTDGEEIVSKRNTLLAVTTVVGALVFGMGVNPSAEYYKRYIDQAVEGNRGVLGVGIEAGARHNVAIEASVGGGVEEGAG
ncbi:unnamed protein product [Prunus armeniaca]|uniref:Uncharacterized protein n=1 Tax=Prunus armeniaca TaxID=36596 RepID=A0A6J5TL81_PRUAR|nr:unnamed protein product [Prunus armeniaca]